MAPSRAGKIGGLCLLTTILLTGLAWGSVVPSDFVDFGTVMADPDTHRYKVAMIGDSHAVYQHTLSTLQARLDNPGYYECAIPGTSWIQTYGLGGYRTDAIRDAINETNYGGGADFVLIMAGTNDLTAGYYGDWNWSSQLNSMVNNMQAIVDRVASPDDPGRPRIIVAGVTPFEDANLTARALEYNNRLKSSLSNVDVFFDDNFYDLWDSSTNSAQGWLMADNAHPNYDGSYRVAENWLQGITALFDQNIFTKYSHVTKMADYLKD